VVVLMMVGWRWTCHNLLNWWLEVKDACFGRGLLLAVAGMQITSV